MGRSRLMLAGLVVLLLGAFYLPSGLAAYTCFGQEATIVGTPTGEEAINGTEGPDVIVGLGGTDYIDGYGGNDRICGNGSNDVIDEDNRLGDDMIAGGAGADDIFGEGDDLMLGGTGPDYIDGNTLGGNDDIRGGPGDDALIGGVGDDIIRGGSGNDYIDDGSPNNDTDKLFGNGGTDTLRGDDLDGLDTLNGGSESDTCISDEGDEEIFCETN